MLYSFPSVCNTFGMHIFFFFFFFGGGGVMLYSFPSVCNTFGVHSLCNLYLQNFSFFIFKLYIMIVHTLKMCTFYFVHIS